MLVPWFKAYIPLRCKTIRVGSWRWLRPPTTHFRIRDTNMLVSKNAKICFSPNANPQRESVEYRLRWIPNANFLRWPCTFHVCAHFICVGYPTRIQFAVEYGLNVQTLKAYRMARKITLIFCFILHRTIGWRTAC